MTGKSSPPRRSRRKPISAAPPQPPLSRLAMDQTMAGLSKILASQDFQSIEDANAFIQQLLNTNDGRLPEFEPETPLERAQVLITQAYDAPSLKRQGELARQALAISPDCADAYCLLAELEPSPPQKLDLFEQAVEAGKRAVGEDAFKQLEGSFWGFVETRPFMRAYSALAELSWMFGNRARALEIYTDMLRLNPNDNQGIRYSLTTCLLEERTPAAQAALQNLLDSYPEDAGSNWAYSRALLFFQLAGRPTEMANQALRDAIAANPHVTPLLLGRKHMPKELPRYMGLGDVDEAVEYVAFAWPAWRHTPGAIAWLQGRSKL